MQKESKIVVIDPQLLHVLKHLKEDEDFMAWLKEPKSEDDIRQTDMRYPNGQVVAEEHKLDLYYFFRMILEENQDGVIH